MPGKISIIHTAGFLIDYNGNLSRIIGEAVNTSNLGLSVGIIISNQVPSKILERAVSKGVKIHRVKKRTYLKHSKMEWRYNNLIPLGSSIKKVMKKEPDSIFHVASPSPVTKPWTSTSLCKRNNVPIVLDLHDPWSHNPFSSNPILYLQTSIMRKVINDADYVVVPYQTLYDLVKKLNQKKPIEIIPNAVDLELFSKVNNENIRINKYGINVGDVVIGFSGHITKSKGLEYLIRATKILKREINNIKILVIGDGPEKDNCMNLTKKMDLVDNIIYLGYVDQNKVVEYLSMADICVAPYANMPFFNVSLPETPLKVVEYMALEKPVIMSEISKNNAISWSGGGILVPPGDVTKLASEIRMLIDDIERARILGKKGRKYVEKHLSWEINARKLKTIYEDINSFR